MGYIVHTHSHFPPPSLPSSWKSWKSRVKSYAWPWPRMDLLLLLCLALWRLFGRAFFSDRELCLNRAWGAIGHNGAVLGGGCGLSVGGGGHKRVRSGDCGRFRVVVAGLVGFWNVRHLLILRRGDGAGLFFIPREQFFSKYLLKVSVQIGRENRCTNCGNTPTIYQTNGNIFFLVKNKTKINGESLHAV